MTLPLTPLVMEPHLGLIMLHHAVFLQIWFPAWEQAARSPLMLTVRTFWHVFVFCLASSMLVLKRQTETGNLAFIVVSLSILQYANLENEGYFQLRKRAFFGELKRQYFSFDETTFSQSGWPLKYSG